MIQDRLTERFREMVEYLGDEIGRAHGWKATVARRVGISPTHLSRLLSGGRRIQWRTAVEASELLGIDMAYFNESKPPAVYFGTPGAAPPAVTYIGSASTEPRMQVAAGLREWADKVQCGEVESIALVIIHGKPPIAHIAFQSVLDGAERLRALGAVRILDELIARQAWGEMTESDLVPHPADEV